MNHKTISKRHSILKPSGNFGDFHWQINTWSQLHQGVSLVRKAIFIDEQRLPEEEVFTQEDIEAVQMLVTHSTTGEFVGAARLTKESPGVSRTSCLGVVYNHRGHHIGKLIMTQLCDFARRRRDRLLLAHVPTYAVVFFKKMGFEIFGEPFSVANVTHVKMQLIL